MDLTKVVIDTLSDLIKQEMVHISSEQGHPSGGPDEMDDAISSGKKRIQTLRRIRNEFEEVMTGVLV